MEKNQGRGTRQIAQKIGGRLTYANVMATIAVFGTLAGGSAYAASKITSRDIAKNAVHSKHIKKNAVKTPKIKNGAVTSEKVKDFGLRLHDLGGRANDGTRTVSSTIDVPAGACAGQIVGIFNPAPSGLIGSLVVGFLTDEDGDAVLSNSAVVVPTIVSETSQGGALAILMVCDLANSGQTVPAGSVFHYHLIGP